MGLSKEQLRDIAVQGTADIAKGYPHMLSVWKAVLGGFVLPELARLDPEAVAGNEAYDALIAEYSAERIRGLTEPKTIEVVREVPTIVEKTVVLRDGEHVTHRRIKTEVHKIRRAVRNLDTYERDLIIRVFNTRQDMLDATSEVCKNLVDSVNASRSPEDKISAPQLAGYWSSLCRMAHHSEASRSSWIAKSIKRGSYTVEPIFTPEFIAKIIANYKMRALEKDERAKDHMEIKKTGVRPRKVIISSTDSSPFGRPVPSYVPPGTPIHLDELSHTPEEVTVALSGIVEEIAKEHGMSVVDIKLRAPMDLTDLS